MEQQEQQKNIDSEGVQETKAQDYSQQPNPYLMPGAIVIAGILIAGTIFMTSGGPASDMPQPTEKTEQPAAEVDLESMIEVAGWPSLGDENAPVLMVEYSDFACPFCSRFWEQTLPLIKENYVDTGQVRFVYKDFPVVGGERASEAAHCAAEQDSFWEYHDLLFSRTTQDRQLWSNVDTHRDYASQLGLDADALAECFEERRYQGKIADALREAQSVGAGGTPYFIIGGTPVSGAQAFSVFQQAIEEALNN